MIKPISVLQIIPQLDTGGAETGCVDVAKALVKQGHLATITTHSGRLIEACSQNNIQVIPLPVHSKSPKTILANAYSLKRIIQQNAIDLVHVRSRAPAWSVYQAMRSLPIPWLTTYHGAYRQSNLLKKFYNSVMTKGQAIIAPSQFMAEHIQYHYPHCTNKIITIPRGINLDTLKQKPKNHPDCQQLAQKWQIQNHEQIILLPARITRLKGHPTCIDAANQIKTWLEQHHVRIIFLGNTSKQRYCQELQQQIQTHKLGHIIQIQPHCQDIVTAYALADMVLICSTQPESFGRTAVEAQAMSKLVIGTNHGGCQETILPEKTGWLVPPGDAHALAKTIITTLELPTNTKETITHQAQQHARQHFSHHEMCAQTLQIYQRLVQKQPLRTKITTS